MSSAAPRSRSALPLSLAATLAFVGSALMLHAGRAYPLLGNAASASGRPGASLLAVVLLLAVTGALLLGLAVHDLLHAPARAAAGARRGTRRRRPAAP
jgi:hypothetical protein